MIGTQNGQARVIQEIFVFSNQFYYELCKDKYKFYWKKFKPYSLPIILFFNTHLGLLWKTGKNNSVLHSWILPKPQQIPETMDKRISFVPDPYTHDKSIHKRALWITEARIIQSSPCRWACFCQFLSLYLSNSTHTENLKFIHSFIFIYG